MKNLLTLLFLLFFLQTIRAQQPDTVRFQLCSELWKDSRPIKGTTLVFQPNNPAFPYTPIVFNLDTTQNCAEVTVVLSDYLPGTTFGYSASLPDTGYLNGVSIVDMCTISRHILGLAPLSSTYTLLAAEVNSSNSITTYDLIQIKKLLQGIHDTLAYNKVWRFVPDYCVFANPLNPFQGGCATGINSDDLAALNGEVAKITGLKIGDVNGDVRLTGEQFAPPVVTDSITLVLPQGQVSAGTHVSIPIKFMEDFTLGNLQVQFLLDPGLARFDSLSDGTIDFTYSVATYDTLTGNLKLVDPIHPFPFFLPAGTPLFYIHLTSLQSADLPAVLKVVHDDFNLYTCATGGNCGQYYGIGSTYSGFVNTSYAPDARGLRVQPPSPNPFSEQTYIEIELESPETALLELTDLAGRILFSEAKNLAAGVSRWEIPASAVPSGSLAIWRLRVAGQTAAGKLARK